MSEIKLPVLLFQQKTYLELIGVFHSNWSSIDLFTDYAIYQFLKVTPQQAHLITSGMMFGRKAALLADLIRHSEHPNKSKILDAFNVIRAAKRTIITHSYIRSDALSVTFMERQNGNKFKAKEHTFTLKELTSHVSEIHNAAIDFYNSLDVTGEELDAFVNAALSLNRRSSKSPHKPTSSK